MESRNYIVYTEVGEYRVFARSRDDAMRQVYAMTYGRARNMTVRPA